MNQRFLRSSFIRRSLALLPLVLLVGCGSPEQRAQGHYESGMALIEKKDDLGARVELLKAVKYNSNKVEVWRALAGVDERTKSSSLFTDLRRIVELDPNDIDSKIRLARIMVGGGAAEAALKVIDAVNEDEKPNAALHALRSIILLKTNDVPGAIREAQRAYEIDPLNIDAVSLLASKKLSDGDPDGAQKLLNLVNIDPKDEARIALLKMQIYAKKGSLPEMEAQVRKLIALSPEEPAYKSQLIQILVAQRRFDEAEKEIRSRAETSRTDTKAGLELVRFLNTTKGPDAARAELDTRIKAGGDTFDYQLTLAELNFAQNRMGDAELSLQSLASTAPSPEKKIIAQAKLAEFYVLKANVAAAEPLIAEILTKDRRNATALRLRAATSIDQGKFDSAISDIREALNDQPKAPDFLLLLALAYERSGKNELADRQYADALKSSGMKPEIALKYVSFLQRQGELARAEEILTEISNRAPGNLQILTTLGQVRLTRQNWTGALAVADTISRLTGGRAVADQVRASALAGQNKIDESIAALEDARKAAPEAVNPVVSLASAYVRQGKPEKAVAMLQEVAKKFPENAQVLVLLGQAQLAQNKPDDALQSFKGAVAKQPSNASGYGALTDYYVQRKNFDAADGVLQAALTQSPGNINFRLSAAGLQILRGNQDAAIAQYDAILKDQPGALVAVNNLVSLLLDFRSNKESLDRAISLAEALKNSAIPQFQDTYGWSQYRRGDYKSAVAILESVAAKLPDLAAVHYHLGMSYAAAGQTEKSREQLQTALALEPDGTSLKESIRSALK